MSSSSPPPSNAAYHPQRDMDSGDDEHSHNNRSHTASVVHFHTDDESMNASPAAAASIAVAVGSDGISQRKNNNNNNGGTNNLHRPNSGISVYELASGTNTDQQRQQQQYGASSSTLTSTGSTRLKRRLPQSGLRLCGRRWLLGAEDMCLPACWSMMFDALLICIACAAWRYIHTSEYNAECTTLEQHQIEAYVAMHVVGYAALLVLDIATMLSALYSSMFVRNRTIVFLIYARLTVTVMVIIFTLLANIEYFQYLRPSCASEDIYAGSITMHRLLTLLFLSSLCSFLIFGTYFLCSYGFGPCCGKGTSQSWGKHIKRWFWCYTPHPSTNGRNVLESISWIFTEFFAADRAAHEGEDVHIVPSDILVGFALVEASQVRRSVQGYKFYKAAPKNRWAPDAFRPTHLERGVTQDEMFQRSYGATNAQAVAMSGLGQPGMYGSSAPGAAMILPPTEPTSAMFSKPRLIDPLSAAVHGVSSALHAQERRENVLEHEKPDSTLADIAGNGHQPPLDLRDWQKILDAQYFSKFANGSYGWLLYAFSDLTCFLTCRACRCGHTSGYQHANMIGSGCEGHLCGRQKGCCHWSIASFLLTTGIEDKDIIYAHLASAPIYYLALDHEQKSIVICCRGTLSVADAVIDLDAQLSPLDSYGYVGGYTHTGILENALRLRDDLDERGHLASVVEMHPDYNIAVVGHSLGAATATLLTFLLRERFDTGVPPPVATSGPLSPATRNKLTCVAYGCPLIVDLTTAHSEFALRCITTIVNHSDIIARLSLATCSLLKDQMISCFAVSSSSKFRILSNSLRKNYAQSFETDIDLTAVASPRDDGSMSPTPAGYQQHHLDSPSSPVGTDMLLGSVARAMEKLDVLPESKEDEAAADRRSRQQERAKQARRASKEEEHARLYRAHVDASAASKANGGREAPSPVPLLQASHQLSPPAPTSTVPSGASSSSSIQLPSIPAVVVTGNNSSSSSSSVAPRNNNPSSPPASTEFTMHLRKCYLPGRIYHLLPGQRGPKRMYGMRRGVRETVVYPASQDTFQEIAVNKTMFADHLPEHYDLKRVKIPNQFINSAMEPVDSKQLLDDHHNQI